MEKEKAGSGDGEFVRDFIRSISSVPTHLGLLLLRVSILKYPPREAVRGLGIPPEQAEAQLILARAMVRSAYFEKGEARS